MADYRVEYVVERHSDVQRYRGSVSAGGQCITVVLVENRSFDPVLVRVLDVGLVAPQVPVPIFRPHAQVTAPSVAFRATFSPHRSDPRRRKPDVIADVMRCDVRTVETAVGRRSGGVWERSRSLDFAA